MPYYTKYILVLDFNLKFKPRLNKDRVEDKIEDKLEDKVVLTLRDILGGK